MSVQAMTVTSLFFLQRVAFTESVLEGTDVNEFVRLIDSSKKRGKRRQRNSVSWSNSVGEEAIMQHRVEAEEAQLRLSESSNCEAISSQLDSQLVLSQVPSTSKAVEEKPRKKCAWRKVETNNNEETVQSHFDKQPDRGEVALNLSWASSPPDNDTDVVSLEQVMREEQDRAKSQQRARQRSWPVEVPRREKARDAGPAWGTACSPKTPPCSLRNIQEDEKHEIELANTTPRYKPMHVLETEERAIRELDEYYRRLYEDDDCVTIGVRREERTPPTERPEHTPLRWRQRKNTGVE